MYAKGDWDILTAKYAEHAREDRKSFLPQMAQINADGDRSPSCIEQLHLTTWAGLLRRTQFEEGKN